ncbi:hypothetical protein AB3G33_01870 [Flavobacterium sp. WC2421]|uniref:hypothetical protein n=1 Tax=Flavobacterium sp. WC2421 TaxID=3234138 RepID=UPI0034677F8C
MFLKNLFKKDELFLKAQIKISDTSSFEVLQKSIVIQDDELILLGLLIFARILRIEPLNSEKETMILIFKEFYSNYEIASDKDDCINKNVDVFNILNNGHDYVTIKEFKTTIKLLRNDEGEFYLNVGTIFVEPLSKLVYTTFVFIVKNIKKENHSSLIKGFYRLARVYEMGDFSAIDAYIVPNVVIDEIRQ